ncbi:MAG TPA: hypothetical protein VFY54_22200 [Rubrobacter sp.]|nr:hypothetical protein [Rubrobacter sp.]
MLVPVSFAPDPAMFDVWAAPRALLQRLRAFLPVDTFLWPTLKGQPADGSPSECVDQAIRRQLREEHHIVNVSTAQEPFLTLLGDRPARSHTAAGYFPFPPSVTGKVDSLLATALEAIRTMAPHPAQFLPQLMQGAEETEIKNAVSKVEGTLNSGFLAGWVQEALAEQQSGILKTIKPSSRTPTLYLSLPVALPGGERIVEIFRSYVPNARVDELHEWGLHLHEEAGGHELADKVIPFIQNVIADREANPQT